METNQSQKVSKFLLPKPHLSWSQMDLWMKNPERYRREYFENGKRLDTKYLQYGKRIAGMIEDGSYKEILPDLVVYEKPEFKIALEVKGVPILSFIDSYDPTFHAFREYKTGKNAWDQAKVQKHGQLLFYAVALKAQFGTTPWECHLDWIETSEAAEETDDFWAKADKKLAITGKIKSFRREFDEREIERMENAIVEVASQIDAAYRSFIGEI